MVVDMSAARTSSSPPRGAAGTLPPDALLSGAAVPSALVAGRYRVVARIDGLFAASSEPPMAVVYEAADTATGEHVALKMAASEPPDRRDEFSFRLQLEGVALTMLESRQIVALRDHGTDDGTPFVVLELLRGETWREEIECLGPQPIGRATWIASEVAAGLEAVHRAGIVHRDVKPENVFLLDDGSVRLFDFGLAKLLEGEDDWLPGYLTLGTPEYMSPEQWQSPDVGPGTDIFALGASLYEALTGLPPFATRAEALRAGRAGAPPRAARTMRPDAPKPLLTALDAMLTTQRASRPSAEEVRQTLERFAERPISAARPAGACRRS